MAAVGISFGDSSAAVSIFRDGHAAVLADHLGERVINTVVGLSNGEIIVGLQAKNAIVRSPRATICHFFRLLGKTYEEVPSPKPWASSCRLQEKDGQPVFTIDLDEDKTRTITANEAVNHLCTYLRATASQAGSVKQVVWAVPATFTAPQREALKAAAGRAGLEVVRMVSEPIAALIAHNIGLDTRDTDATYVVVDVGGTQMAATVVALRNGFFSTLAHVVDAECGGRDIDTGLVEILATEFQRKTRMNVREEARAMAKLRAAAEAAKKTLSSRPTAAVSIESLHEGVDLQCEVARPRLELACTTLCKKLTDLVTNALAAAAVQPAAVAKVVLAGGTSRVVVIKSTLARIFPTAVLDDSIATEEIFALGASVVAGSPPLEEVGLGLPVTVEGVAKSIVVTTDDGTKKLLIPAHTPLPVRRRAVFSSTTEGQTALTLTIAEEEGETLTPLARIVMKHDTELLTHVELTVHIDKGHHMRVEAEEPSWKKVIRGDIKPSA
eukprot:m.10643 g.10643  ORF g.10643 m.10643 type:complete len:497 (+) comp5642_c0_seq1:8-1498(+)